jgi:ribonuclease G
MIRLLAACMPGEIRIAAADGERLLDYALWRPGAPDGVGDLHRGRVQSVLPALGGAFVALADSVGFLPSREGAARVGDGDRILVRVVRSAQGGKGPRLARVDGDPGDGPVALLQPGPDPLTRLAAFHADAPILADDPGLAATLAPSLRARVTRETTVWSPSIAQQVDSLAQTEIALPGGMRASFHPTPALVAIDLDGGGSSAGRAAKPVAQLAANRAAIGPLLHQIRLRNLSGAILIDPAGLPAKKRAALTVEIEAALANDPLRPRLLGFTRLGLAEIVRARIHPPLHELLAGPHAAGLEALAEAARLVAAAPHRLPALAAGLGVAAALEHDAFAREALARRAGRPISIRIDPSLPPNGWKLDHA